MNKSTKKSSEKALKRMRQSEYFELNQNKRIKSDRELKNWIENMKKSR